MILDSEFKIIKAGIYDSKYIFNCKDGYQTKDRFIKNYEIELFAEDGGTAFINNAEYAMKKNFMLISKPGQHRHSRLHFKVYYMHLDVRNEYLKKQLDALPDFYEISHPKAYVELIRKFANAADNDFPNRELYLNSKIYELLYMLHNDAKRIDKVVGESKHIELEIAVQYMNSNYRKALKLEDIAAHVGLSPIYFHKLFKAAYGLTPNEYLLDIRIGAAKSILLFDNASIDIVAAECGFNSATYFSTVFKKKTNMSPFQFRKKELNKYEL